MRSATPGTKGSVDIELPDQNTLGALLPSEGPAGTVRCPNYTIGDADHALRHASSLLHILHGVALPDQTPQQPVNPFPKHIAWLIDCIEALNEEQKRWRDHATYDPVSLLSLALKLISPHSGVEQAVIHKLYTVTVLLAAAVSVNQTGSPNPDPVDSSATKVLALALIQIADAAIKQRPLAKLAAAQLLKPLEQMLAEGVAGDISGDLQVRPPWQCSVYAKSDLIRKQRAVNLFREAVVFPTNQSFSLGLSPRAFADRDIRLKVRSIESKAHAPTEREPLAKRRKLTKEFASMQIQLVLRQLCRVLGLPQETNLNQLESHIL
jgi:serine/threonine-protein kinase ATR